MSTVDRLPAARFKALSEPSRLDILALLHHHGELCVCDVMATLQITQSRASRHLSVLAQAGFVEGRRAGMWVHYRVVPEPEPLVASLVGLVAQGFPPDRLAAISRRLAEVLLVYGLGHSLLVLVAGVATVASSDCDAEDFVVGLP
jgi:ArsR family transcriptional regulator